jgi:uncharacterized protein YbjT (DUF2867 family)
MSQAPVLVVGASGQLGSRVVRVLAQQGVPVRAFVRGASRQDHLRRPGVELVHGDLTDPASIAAACRGARAVVATANAVAPVGGGGFEAVEGRGYAALIAACRREGVGRFVMISVPVVAGGMQVPTFRYKRLNEARLRDSGLEHSVLRAAPFMDDWFCFMGSRLPARGDEAALIARPWPFLQRFIGSIENLIERRGLALVAGSATTRHAFVAIDDVAQFLVRAIEDAQARNAVFEIGGPQVLSWREVADIFARVLGRPVRTLSTPAFVFRAQQRLMRPFSEAAANVMGLNWLAAQETLYDSKALATRLGVRLTSAEDFLRAKAALPA